MAVVQLRASWTELPSASGEGAGSSRFSSSGCGSLRTKFVSGSGFTLHSTLQCGFLSGEFSSGAVVSANRSFVTSSQKNGSALVEHVFDDYPRGYSTTVIRDEDYRSDRDHEEGDLGYESSSTDGTLISTLGLSPEIEDALSNRGIVKLFPIQDAVLKPAMDGKDLIARAKTGTGKTLAFGIPIIERLTKENNELRGSRRRNPRALILAPTRELAKQVEKEFFESAPNLNTICVYGGVSIENQIRQLKRGVDVAVGTPGRIIDLINRGALHLGEVKHLVLDEADQMLAVGFEEDVEVILESLPVSRQTCLFSATMPAWVKKLSKKYLNDPLTIDLVGDSDEKLASGIKMMCVRSSTNAKRSILSDLIAVHAKGNKTIVFTQTKKDADEVSVSVGRSLGCEALHGDISQLQREKTLQGFRDGRFTVLVATDVAARGLDVPNVDLVIHYEVPNDSETFVHRTGRTGRAGKEGSAILMFTDSQVRTVKNIERDVGCRFEYIDPPSVDEVLQATAQQASDAIARVHPDLVNVFLPSAESLLEKQGVQALAAAIAYMSGFTQPPPPRSLITFEKGLCTVRVVVDSKSSVAPVDSPRIVLSMLSKFYRPAADNIGKIKLISDRNVEGAVFDLPENIAKELISMSTEEIKFDLVKKLPRLVEDAPSRGRSDMYGRFSNQSRPRTSWDRGYANDGAYASRYDRGSSRSSDRFSDRGRSDRYSSDPWGSSNRSSTSGRRAFSSGSKYDNESNVFPKSLPSLSPRSKSGFDGVCFLCKKTGHRAADCPSLG